MGETLHWLDILVVILYFVVIIGYGVWLTKRVKSSDGYFTGGRKFSWWIMMGQGFGAGTHAENFVAQTGACYQLGFAAIWYQWKNMIITPFYWLIAPWYRRSERTTVGEIVEDRYGRGLGYFYSIFAILFFVFAQGALLKGGGKVISVAFGGIVSVNWVVIAMTVAFVIYSFFGGLVASAYANFIQALMIVGLSFMLIPSGLIEIGGFSGMRELLPENYYDLFSSEIGIGFFTILMLALNGLVGITAQPHMVSMCATGENERAGRIGQTYGSLVKRLVTIGWAFTGLIVAALIIQSGEHLEDPEMAFGYATRVLLSPGLTGLMVAAVLAANMSSASNFMVNTGAIFTRNIYQVFINKNPNDNQLLWMGRFSGLGLTILGVLFALYIENVLQAFLFIETTSAFVGIAVFGGFIWKRANRYGASLGISISFLTYYYLNYLAVGKIDLVYNWTPEIFGWAMLIGFAAFIFGSLFTKKESGIRIEKFFNNMERLSDNDVIVNKIKPLASNYGKDLLLIDLTGFVKKERRRNFLSRYKEDLTGFILATGFVGILILLAWGVVQL